MKFFECDHCGHIVSFENSQCVKCGRGLAYVPELSEMRSFELPKASPAAEPAPTEPSPPASAAAPPAAAPAADSEHVIKEKDQVWKLCSNYTQERICNWAVLESDGNPLCRSCRLTRVIPDLSIAGNRDAWFKLETAKRRLVYLLMHLALPIANKIEDPEQGMAFEFLGQAGPNSEPVMTGHADGVVTINIAEADDVERERVRTLMHEPYRTLLGHLRHEVGHYYWDRLVRDSGHIERFRELFGDDQQDYGEALQRHYDNGAPPNWQDSYISAYATMHPWEDWAETWAHYLLIRDVLETASASGLKMEPPKRRGPAVAIKPAPADTITQFDQMIKDWFPLTYLINNLDRGLGQPDGYCIVLSTPAIEKMRFVHDVVSEIAAANGRKRQPTGMAATLAAMLRSVLA